jgi:hypothetical protein
MNLAKHILVDQLLVGSVVNDVKLAREDQLHRTPKPANLLI